MLFRSDLFFDYLDLVGKLRPKVAIAENVKGMILGNAKGYTRMVISRFKELGYRPQLFLVNAADCGVPQRRERVFFCALRDDIQRQELILNPKHRWISTSEATADLQHLTSAERDDTSPTAKDLELWPLTEQGNLYADAYERKYGKRAFFNNFRQHPNRPSNTLSGVSWVITHWSQCRTLTFREWKRLGSFPDDYHAKTDKIGKYMIGMSVPPKMTEVVARAVCSQWLGVDYALLNK